MQAYTDIDALKEVSRANLRLWLLNHGGISGDPAEEYIQLLFKSGAGTVDALEDEIEHDKSFLTTVGIRSNHVNRIMRSYSAKSAAVVKKEQSGSSSSNRSSSSGTVAGAAAGAAHNDNSKRKQNQPGALMSHSRKGVGANGSSSAGAGTSLLPVIVTPNERQAQNSSELIRSSSSSSSGKRGSRSGKNNRSDNHIDEETGGCDDETENYWVDLTKEEEDDDDKQRSSKKRKKSAKDSQGAAAGASGINIRAFTAINVQEATITSRSLWEKRNEIRRYAQNAQKIAREQASKAEPLVLRLQGKTSGTKDCEVVDYELELKALKKLKGGPFKSLKGEYTGEVVYRGNIDYPHGLGSVTLKSDDITHFLRWICTGKFENGTLQKWCKVDHRKCLEEYNENRWNAVESLAHRYEGEVRNTDYHGYGVLTSYNSAVSSNSGSSSSSSSSSYKMADREGEVEEIYEGQFKERKKHGFGIWTKKGSNGNSSSSRSSSSSSSSGGGGDQDDADHVYMGYWFNDQMNGRGMYTSGGVVQDGMWVNDQFLLS